MDFINLRASQRYYAQKLTLGYCVEGPVREHRSVLSTSLFSPVDETVLSNWWGAALLAGATVAQSTATKAPAEDRGTQSEFKSDVLFPSGGPGRKEEEKMQVGKKIIKRNT